MFGVAGILGRALVAAKEVLSEIEMFRQSSLVSEALRLWDTESPCVFAAESSKVWTIPDQARHPAILLNDSVATLEGR